ncbi:MAG: TonB-dependent receptor [Pseudomonadota bacterium]
MLLASTNPENCQRGWRAVFTLWRPWALLLLLHSGFVSGQVQEMFQFAIPALPLKEAILEFSISRNLDVVFVTELAEGLSANPVQGQHSLTNALETLFHGTGLRARVTTDRSISIERVPAKPARPRPSLRRQPEKSEPLSLSHPPNVTEEVVVVAKLVSPYRLGVSSSSTKTQRRFLQTPQLVNGVSAQVISDAAFRDYTDISQLASSVDFLEASSGVTNELRLRGFAYPSLKLNGYASHAYNRPPDLAFIDRIEVAKGPSSVLYGRMEPGGIVNMMLKRPQHEPAHLLRVRASDRDYGKLVLDSNVLLRHDMLFRVILLEQQEGERERFDQNDNRGLSVMMEKGLRDGASMNLSYQFERQQTASSFGSPSSRIAEQIQVASLDGRFLLLDAIQNDLRTTIDLDSHSLQWSIENWEVDGWNVNLQFQYDRYRSGSVIAYPFVNEDATMDVSQALSDVEALAETDDDALDQAIDELEQASLALDIRDEDIERVNVAINNDARFYSGEATAVKQFDWFGYEVEQLYGVNLGHSQPQRLVLQNHDTRGTINRDESFLAINDDDTPIDVTEQNLALFAQWIVTLSDRTALFTGGRYDYIDLESASAFVPIDRTLREFTWRAGLVFETSGSSSVYANYSEAFTPQFTQAETLIAGNDDEDGTREFLLIPEPARSQQWELGAKQEWWDAQLQSSCALYQLVKKGIVARTREQRNRGIECDIAGQIGKHWQLLLSYNRIDAEITRGSNEIVGNTPRVMPDQAFKFWLSYSQPWRQHSELGVNVGAKRISERFADDDNDVVLEAYTVVDIGAYWRYRDRFDARLNIKNLLDEDFDEGAFDNAPFWVNKGRRRTVELTLDFHF